MVTKRALKTFKCPPNLSEKMGGEERVKLLKESLDSVVDDERANVGRIQVTHAKLWEDIDLVVHRLWRVSQKLGTQGGDEMDEIIYEDSRARMMDCMEKLTTPCPYTKQDMFGRDKEIAIIKPQLLKRVVEGSDITFCVIGGEAGVGKTMLAQCLYDDTDVCEAFQLRHWINCSDKEVTLDDEDGDYNEDDITRTLMGYIIRKLFSPQERCRSALIVFDGWKEEVISNIKSVFSIEDSKLPPCVRIVITTPGSRGTTLLEGLAEEESWAMFESVAFSSELTTEERSKILDSKMGTKILNMCSNNPCVIKTVASILSTKTTLDDWTHFVEVVWPSIPAPLEMIASTFNLVAFKRLPFLMKRCLLFCSLFPRDYEFNRVDLNLWLAREFEIDNSQELVDVELNGGEYFQSLQKMGYFVEHAGKDEYDCLTYKMPSFSHEFVKLMAKLDYNEYQIYQSGGHGEHSIDLETVRHVSFIVNDAFCHGPPWLSKAQKLRSLLLLGENCRWTLRGIKDIIASLKYLQILSGNIEISERLLSNIGNPELLRSLRLGTTNSKFLGEFVARTKNLTLLDIQHLDDVHVLPEKFHKLRSLRHFYVRCTLKDQVTPSRGELVSLTDFNVFVTAGDNDLDTLVDYNYIVENQMIDYDTRNEILKDDQVSNVALCWQSPSHRDDDVVVKTLEAPARLENMMVRCWKGLRVPRFLGLVSLQIMDCHECRYLPSLSTLPRLKSLKLWNLGALEYIENDEHSEDEQYYFSSLESLMLGNLPKVKAWGEHFGKAPSKLIPRLTEIQVSNTKLEYLPLERTVASIEANDISLELLKCLINSTESSTPTVQGLYHSALLKTLNITAIHGLESIRIDLPKLESLIIRQCHQLTSLVVEPGPIKSLQVRECSRLRKFWEYIPQFEQLEKLEIGCCEQLDLQEIGLWKSLSKNLRHLKLVNFTKLESLPSGLSCLTALETLLISWVYNLKELPECIGNLKQLGRIVVRHCPSLTTVPESLGHLMDASTALQVEFRACGALKSLPKSFPRNQSSRLVIKECPKLERSMSQVL